MDATHCPSSATPSAHGSQFSCEACHSTHTLTLPCPECDGRGEYAQIGCADRNGFPRIIQCWMCLGTGERVEACFCQDVAIAALVHTNRVLCELHAFRSAQVSA